MDSDIPIQDSIPNNASQLSTDTNNFSTTTDTDTITPQANIATQDMTPTSTTDVESTLSSNSQIAPSSSSLTSTSVSKQEMVQIIDYDESFSESFDQYLNEAQVSKLGFDYHVVAVMGPQSSGKSTLLNMIFNTHFQTMDSVKGRYQVTQGVWSAFDASSSTLVFDLEGTDSRERGEDAATFERKSALFALAIAEVLIINMWTQDVGRLQAANLSLLRTVLEMDMQLFQNSDESSNSPLYKTKLLFVLRDHIESATPLTKLAETLTADVNNIWKNIQKPEIYIESNVKEFFDLEFTSLPHKVLMPSDFTLAGEKLKARFNTLKGIPNSQPPIFHKEYARGVAADGFSTYAQNVWQVIRSNKELDIPSQKEMLSQVRCETLAAEAITAAEESFVTLENQALHVDSSPPDFEKPLALALSQAVRDAFSYYDSKAHRYSPKAAAVKRLFLSEKVSLRAKNIFDSYLSSVSDLQYTAFKKNLKDITKSAQPWVNFNKVSQELVTSVSETFEKSAGASLETLPELNQLCTAGTNRLVTRCIESLEAKKSEVEKLTRDHVVSNYSNAINSPLHSVLEQAPDDVWTRISTIAESGWDNIWSQSHMYFGTDGLSLNSEELAWIKEEIQKDCFDLTVKETSTVVGSPSSLLLQVMKKFDDTFRIDERGVPRTWGKHDDIEEIFITAKEKAEQMLDRFTDLNIKMGSHELTKSTLSFSEKEILKEKVRSQATQSFVEAKRQQDAISVQSKIPWWIFLLLAVFGFDEFMAVVRSPALLISCLIVGPLIYAFYVLDLWKVVEPMGQAALGPLIDNAKDFIRPYVEANPQSRAAKANSYASVGSPSESGSGSASSITANIE